MKKIKVIVPVTTSLWNDSIRQVFERYKNLDTVIEITNLNTGSEAKCFLPLFLSPSCSNFLTVLRRNLKPIEEIKEKEASHGREKKEKAFK